MEKGQSCVVPISREIDEGKKLSALQFSEEIKKKELTFLAILKLYEEGKEVQAPKVIQKMLEESKDVMPTELPKRFPPRRKASNAIALESGAKPTRICPSPHGTFKARGANRTSKGVI